MTNRPRHIACFVTLLAMSAATATAQDHDEDLPKRPDLPEYADTNDAMAYYNWGVENLTNRPERAANAFYWASRLAPNMAAPLYARRVALLMSLPPHRLIGYMEGRKSVLRSDEIRAIDSLELRALMRDPVLYRNLDRELVMAYFEQSAQRALGHSVSPNEIRYWLETYMRQNAAASDEWNAWLAYNDRRFFESLDLYGRALRRSKHKADLYTDRGRVFYLIQHYDSAQASFQQAIDILREEDDEELVRVYRSKAMLEYTTGIVLEEAGDIDGAREAHGRALLEDLAFYPAHLHLGALALNQGDTAQAIAELELAAQVAPNEATPFLALSVALRDGGQYERAAEMCDRAIAIEPYYAIAYLMHGSLLEALGDGLAALNRYREFVAHTAAGDDRLAWVGERIEAIELAMEVRQ